MERSLSIYSIACGSVNLYSHCGINMAVSQKGWYWSSSRTSPITPGHILSGCRQCASLSHPSTHFPKSPCSASLILDQIISLSMSLISVLYFPHSLHSSFWVKGCFEGEAQFINSNQLSNPQILLGLNISYFHLLWFLFHVIWVIHMDIDKVLGKFSVTFLHWFLLRFFCCDQRPLW